MLVLAIICALVAAGLIYLGRRERSSLITLLGVAFGIACIVFLVLLFTDDANAAVVVAAPSDRVIEDPQRVAGIPTEVFWSTVAGALVMIPSYLFNTYLPHTDDRWKGLVVLFFATVAGAITELLSTSADTIGLNGTTGMFILVAVVSAFASHFGFWKPTQIGTVFGQGQNRNMERGGRLGRG